MSTQTDTGISRRTWRVAVIVFLTVLLGGTGLSGAAALWSVQGTATATVETGYWVQRNFDLPISVTATPWSGGHTSGLRGVELNWAPAPGQKLPQDVEVTYKVEGKGLDWIFIPNRIESGLPFEGTGTNQQIQITRPIALPERFQITVTPSIDGIPGQSSTQQFRLYRDGTIQAL